MAGNETLKVVDWSTRDQKESEAVELLRRCTAETEKM